MEKRKILHYPRFKDIHSSPKERQPLERLTGCKTGCTVVPKIGISQNRKLKKANFVCR